MNGPEHYREAERLLAEAKRATVVTGAGDGDVSPAAHIWVIDPPLAANGHLVAAAQVHATLALAATNESRPVDDMPRGLISPREAANRLGLNEKTIRRYIAAGRLTGYRLGPKAVRVDAAELASLVTGGDDD